MYLIKENAYIAKKDDEYILGNRETGKWIKIAEEKLNEINNALNRCDDNYIETKYKTLITEGIISRSDEEQEEKTFTSIMIAITNRCNLRCLHCGFSANEYDKNEIPIDLIKNLIRKNPQLEDVTITGGEPLLYSEISELLRLLNEEFDGQKTLMTNATLINEKNVGLLAKTFNEISISMDGASKKSVDKMRGKGAYDRIINGVNLLKNEGFNNISLSMTRTEFNYNEENDFLELCKCLEVRPNFRDLFFVGRAKENKSILYSSNLFKIETPKLSDADIEMERKNICLRGGCRAGIDNMYIQYDGSVYPCPVAATNIDYKIGEIKQDNCNLGDLKKSDCYYLGCENFRSVSPSNVEKCRDCDVNQFCWSCLQDYYECINNDAIFNSFCMERKEALMKVVWG